MTGDSSQRRDRSEAKSDVPLAIRTTRRIAVLEGGLNGRGVDRPTFLTSDGNPEGTPHVLRIPTFSRLVSEGCPRPRMLYQIPETGPGSRLRVRPSTMGTDSDQKLQGGTYWHVVTSVQMLLRAARGDGE